MNKLILNSIKNIQEKQTLEGRDYFRVIFNGFDNNNNPVEIRINMSLNQFNELTNKMDISYNEELDYIHNNKKLTLEIDYKGLTKSKNPKPLIETKTGRYNQYTYDYLSASPAILIENGIISPEKFKRTFTKLFKN